MRLDVDNKHAMQGTESGGVAKPTVPGRAGSTDSAALAGLDIGLFRALRKLNTPKARICSAMWLSYAEYDEISKLT